MVHLSEMANGQSRNLLSQIEAGSQRTSVLEQKIENLGRVIGEKTRDDVETKTQTMGLVESQVLNIVDARNLRPIGKPGPAKKERYVSHLPVGL